MRLAEFKTRLFIFFAGRLLKWAESIEREITNGQSPPAPVVDDSNAVLFAESSRESEAASDPPEHWARLVRSGPPQHWLNLLREKAPHLLPLSEKQLPSTRAEVENLGREDFKADSVQETSDLSLSEGGAVEGSKPRPLSPPGSGREPNYSSNVIKSAWLNRLRFRPPSRRAENADATYVSNTQTRNSDSFRAAGGAAEESNVGTSREPGFDKTLGEEAIAGGDLASDRAPDKTIEPMQTVARLASSLSPTPTLDKATKVRHTITRSTLSPGNEWPETEYHPHRQAGSEHEELQPADSELPHWESFSNHSPGPSRPELNTPETVKYRLHTNRLNIPSEDGAKHITRAASRYESIADHQVESSSGERATSNRQLDRARGVDSELRERPSSSASLFYKMGLDEPAPELYRAQSANEKGAARIRHIRTVAPTEIGSTAPVSSTLANARVANQQSPSNEPVFNRVTSTERLRKEFAPADSPERPAGESRADSNENVWPTLPSLPKFDVADELAAKEREAEGLRRLEQEQRGTLWNA